MLLPWLSRRLSAASAGLWRARPPIGNSTGPSRLRTPGSGGSRGYSAGLDFKPGAHSRQMEALEAASRRDVVLFSYEAPADVFRRYLLAMALLPLWTYLAKVAWDLKGQVEPYADKVSAGKRWALDHVTAASGGVAMGFFLFGAGVSSYWALRTMNTVRRLVLRKGGKHVTVVIYGLTGRGAKAFTVPVSHCSAVHAPFYGRQRFFLRIHQRAFKYQLNLEDGVFANKPLFDKTVGLRRRI